MSNPNQNEADKLSSFHAHLLKSKRILALLGAGLSASSGLPTFRGAGGLWRTHDATSIATPEAFNTDPSFVWQFYSYRRHMALNAQPNPAHYALAELAKRNPNFITLSQNIDGLSPRAGHPEAQLKLLHGSLYDIKCVRERRCGYIDRNNFTDPIVPALAIPQGSADPTSLVSATASASAPLTAPTDKRPSTTDTTDPDKSITVDTERSTDSNPSTPPPPNPLIHGLDISNHHHPLPTIPLSHLPRCPRCSSLLRPGVVWFGESLPHRVLSDVDHFLNDPEPIDLMLVIGTSGTVFPAAAYADVAREKGARVAVVNLDPEGGADLGEGDWFFRGDAARVVPEMFRVVIGDVSVAAAAAATGEGKEGS